MNAVSIWWLLIVVNEIFSPANANWFTGNLCWSMPCLNGGSCYGSAYTYLCICPVNYSGAHCEKRIGICHENPCGNRGLCIEKNLTSFECRCYFDYMGPTCEEHVSKNLPNIWSSLLPAHTKVLFDMLKEAYRAKAKQRALTTSNDQVDFMGLLGLTEPRTTTPISFSSTTINLDLTTDENELKETDRVTNEQSNETEATTFDLNTTLASDMNSNDFTEHYDTTASTTLADNNSEMISSSTTTENVPTIDGDEVQYTTPNLIDHGTSIITTERFNTDLISVSLESSNDSTNETVAINETKTEPSISPMYNDAASTNIPLNAAKRLDAAAAAYPSTDNGIAYTWTSTVPLETNTSQLASSTSQNTRVSSPARTQLLYKLCRQILSHILPNGSSTVTAPTISLVSHSSSINNNTADKFLSWLSKYLGASKLITTSSTMPSITTTEIRTSSLPLQRVDMDDVLHEIHNNNNNNES